MVKKNSNVKTFKINCLTLTQSKRNILWDLCVEYAEIYNYASKFLPSLPEEYWLPTNPSKLYTKWIKSGEIQRKNIGSHESYNALKDSATNYKSAISNNKNSRKGLKIQEMKPNIIKFDNSRYNIVKIENNKFGIYIGSKNSKRMSMFIPLNIGNFKEAICHFDTVIECGKNPGVITYNFRDNTISIPMRFESEKFLKKAELKTFIGVDIGVNNTMALSAIQIKQGEQIIKGVEIFSAREHNNRIKRIKNKNDKLKSSGKSITNVIRNIQNTSTHQMSRKIVDFALQFENPIVFFEDLKSMKKNQLREKNGGNKGKGVRRMISTWPYAELITKTNYKLNAEGLYSMELNPRYTSQRCSRCNAPNSMKNSITGVRNGDNFYCEKCDYGRGSSPRGAIGKMNVDVNASINIARLGLFVLYGRKEGRFALPNGQPDETVGNPIPTEMNGTDGTTIVEAVSLEKQTLVCS